MKIWVPLIILSISAVTIAIEFRVGLQYYAQAAGAPWAQATLRECVRKARNPVTANP
jgi:hypothetical protein